MAPRNVVALDIKPQWPIAERDLQTTHFDLGLILDDFAPGLPKQRIGISDFIDDRINGKFRLDPNRGLTAFAKNQLG